MDMRRSRLESLGKRTFRGSREALLQKAVEEPDLTWRVLTTLNVFRLLICAGLLLQFFAGSDIRIFGERYPMLFAATATGYAVIAMLFSYMLQQRRASIGVQAAAQALVDIAAITVLMHASGGIESGLGNLLVVFIGALSLALPIQYPALLAAAASLAILGEQIFLVAARRPGQLPRCRRAGRHHLWPCAGRETACPAYPGERGTGTAVRHRPEEPVRAE